ncbi:hypothetical protein RFI_34874, partial [Reticulomyxa filosa]
MSETYIVQVPKRYKKKPKGGDCNHNNKCVYVYFCLLNNILVKLVRNAPIMIKVLFFFGLKNKEITKKNNNKKVYKGYMEEYELMKQKHPYFGALEAP